MLNEKKEEEKEVSKLETLDREEMLDREREEEERSPYEEYIDEFEHDSTDWDVFDEENPDTKREDFKQT